MVTGYIDKTFKHKNRDGSYMNAEKLSNFIVIKSFSDNEQSLLDCIR